MNGRARLSIVAAAVAAGCGGPGGPSPAETLTYGVPSPPTAVYHVGDTMTIDIETPAGNMAVTGVGSVTLGLAFRTDPAGVRVVGTVEAFEGSITHPLMGTETAGLDDLSGSFEVLIGRDGVQEVVSFPEISGGVAQMSSFPALGYLLFPRMPGGNVDPGTTWVDTVTTSAETEGESNTTTAVSTYTLVGDTLVGGRSGQLISNMIAYHMQTSLNWGLAAAIGGLLLAFVLVLYLVYDRLVGIERMRLG